MKFTMYYNYAGRVEIEADNIEAAVDKLNEMSDEALLEDAEFDLYDIAEDEEDE